MPKRLVEITSDFPELLPALVSAKQEPPYSIVKREDKYYLSFFDSADLRDTEKAKQSADVLLSNINGMLTLPPFRVANALKRANYIITEDENGNVVGEGSRIIGLRLVVSTDFTSMDFSSLLEMGEKASRLSRIKEALRYYGQDKSWFNLYDVYECIRKDIKEAEGEEREIPEHWLMDSHGRNRLEDFTESANNANISGYAARHTYAGSKATERINDKIVRLKENGKEIMTMTLAEAATFIEDLLMRWIKYRTIHF